MRDFNDIQRTFIDGYGQLVYKIQGETFVIIGARDSVQSIFIQETRVTWRMITLIDHIKLR